MQRHLAGLRAPRIIYKPGYHSKGGNWYAEGGNGIRYTKAIQPLVEVFCNRHKYVDKTGQLMS